MAINSAQEELIQRFATVVEAYCQWIEESVGVEYEEIKKLQTWLAELHVVVINLPDLGCEDQDISVDRGQKVYHKLLQNLPFDIYWDVFDPLNHEETESVANSLADDLSDIYHDLKQGLSYYQAGHLADAVWEWRFSFRIHWGAHLIGAQRAIHSYLCA